MNDSAPGGTGTASAPVEERLRAALAARARSVGPADLRPARPPSAAARSRRPPLRRVTIGLLALAAVAALVFLTVRNEQPRPSAPARSPRPMTTGTATPPPTTVPPQPARPSPSSPAP
ncbi:hypothetical protein [Streptomyces sp. NPDC004014]